MSITEQIVLHIAIIGQRSSGKSSLVIREVEAVFRQCITFSFDYNIERKIGQTNVECIYYHSNFGNQRNEKAQISILNNCDAFGMCFSLNNYNQFKSTYFDIRRQMKGPNKPIWLIGTKADLQCKVNQQQIDSYAKQFRLRYIETSAKLNIGVKQLFEQISIAALKAKLDKGKQKVLPTQIVNKRKCQIM